MLQIPSQTHVETSPSFDRNWYRVQNVLQSLLALVVLAGLAGVFGGGWLSTTVVELGPIEVTYARLARKTVPFRITLSSRGRGISGPMLITLGHQLTEKSAVIRTIPAAASSRDTPEGTEYAFASAATQALIVLSVQPDAFGIFDWKLKVEGVGEASLFQVIYP